MRSVTLALALAVAFAAFAHEPTTVILVRHAEKNLDVDTFKTVVVVGHTNTTRDVMKALGIADAPFIAESEYDNFFIVTLAEGQPARMIPLKYGAAAR